MLTSPSGSFPRQLSSLDGDDNVYNSSDHIQQGNWSTSSSYEGYTSFEITYSQVDKALAWFRLIVGTLYIVLGVYALVHFYSSRWILDIRARSARLVVLGGAGIVLSYLTSINQSCHILWGYGWSWSWTAVILFFMVPLLYGSYLCRAVRLAVVFHPRAKRALPWLIPERNHVYFLLIMACANVGVPIYIEHSMEIWEAVSKQAEVMAFFSVSFTVSLACLYPFIRKVDDMFNISKELMAVSVLLLVLAFGSKVMISHRDNEPLYRWIGPSMLNFVVAGFIFGISVVDPLRRLAKDPLAASSSGKRTDVVLLRGRETATDPPTLSGGDSGDSTTTVENSDASGRGYHVGDGRGGAAVGVGRGRIVPMRRDGSYSSHSYRRHSWGNDIMEMDDVWNFERLASTPLLAAAFEQFCHKALCHESVIFLREVARYKHGDFSMPSDVVEQSQYDAFCRIASTFIKPGARDEVNISDCDKKRILKWLQGGKEAFEEAPEEDRRKIFEQAYVEVKSMLEANLLRRFLQTEEFENFKLLRESVTAMIVSPQSKLRV